MPKGKAHSAKARKASGGKSAKASRSPGGEKKKGKKAKSALGGKTFATQPPERDPDMLDPAAMENLYYMAHTVPHALELRGYTWIDAPKGKKGKKKKKK